MSTYEFDLGKIYLKKEVLIILWVKMSLVIAFETNLSVEIVWITISDWLENFSKYLKLTRQQKRLLTARLSYQKISKM